MPFSLSFGRSSCSWCEACHVRPIAHRSVPRCALPRFFRGGKNRCIATSRSRCGRSHQNVGQPLRVTSPAGTSGRGPPPTFFLSATPHPPSRRAGVSWRTSMKREILINATPRETRVAIIEDDQLVELLVDRPDARRMVGDIYFGRVDAVLPGIQAAFVDIGTEKSAFLHASDVVYDEGEGDGE